MEESVRKQRESIEKQRAAVRAQLPASAQKPESFFTVPWSQPLTVAALAPSPTPDCDPVPPDEIGAIVAEASAREGLTPDLLRAVIEKESSYLPCAVSVKGAQGLMQLMPSTAADLGVGDPFDPLENVEAGARFLKQLLVRYDGSLPLALAAYNAGPGRVDSARGIPLIPETRNYVTEILGRFGSR
jgi:soluble lytic murein transglycosylase-like protein